jgi:hypothetical protein
MQYPSLPLKKFSELLFRSCPLLNRWSADHDAAFEQWQQYKIRVPVCGAIMLNAACDKVRAVDQMVAHAACLHLLTRSVRPRQGVEAVFGLGLPEGKD